MNMVNAQRLIAVRRAKGLTQQQVASRAGLALSTVAKLEQGRGVSTGAATLLRIADALGCSAAGLLEDESVETGAGT